MDAEKPENMYHQCYDNGKTNTVRCCQGRGNGIVYQLGQRGSCLIHYGVQCYIYYHQHAPGTMEANTSEREAGTVSGREIFPKSRFLM